MKANFLFLTLSVFLSLIYTGEAIQCYECDSNEDTTCPTYWYFDTRINAVKDCNGFEANVPGLFCVKITQESPGWNGWKKVTRRCGSRTGLGVAWGCRWTWDHVGVFREICYCEDRDGCNGAGQVYPKVIVSSMLALIVTLVNWL